MTTARPERDARWYELSREIIQLWSGLVRATRIYDRENAVITAVVERIRGIVLLLLEDGLDLELAVRHDSIFIAGERIREGSAASASYYRLIDLMRAARLGSFRVDEEISANEIEVFGRLLSETAEGKRGPDELDRELAVRGVTHLEVSSVPEEEALAHTVDAEHVAKRVYLRSIGVLKNVFLELRSRDRVNVRRVKRVVQQMIESMDQDPAYLLNLSTLKNYDEYTFNHSVNVGVLAIALGRHIGLSRRQLYVVGQVGMFHDIGKLCVPKEVLNKPGRLTPEERRLVQSHALQGFITNASKLGVSAETIEVALGAYEHHINIDGHGYPQPQTPRPLGLLTRILSIADRYDAMTSRRVYRAPIPPPKALAILFNTQRSSVDQVLLRYFMNLMGYYPLGTVVRLSDNSVAVVVGASHTALRHLPVVATILDTRGRPDRARTIDLAERAGEPDAPTVAEVLDAQEYGIEPMDYLL
jgi:HD-GYP domain-containing protein (c-di-GMP phosphodiesterase class II)